MSEKTILSITQSPNGAIEAELSTRLEDYNGIPGMRVGIAALCKKFSVEPGQSTIRMVVDGQKGPTEVIVNGENHPELARSVIAAKLGKLVVQAFSEMTGGKETCTTVS